ncbi:MAG: transcription elongation factor GreA [Alphaproteobacteria bacterium]|nr:transcription elongation factor GreA [Alphaproteobacteria bacterium]MCB9929998.1 transcription elongation factor GreA [Alphaproteobacteria bacterium]
MDKVPMTPAGYQRLEEELRRLKSEARPSVIRAIAEARAHGDLSENAEYHAAKEKQAFIEGRIAELEDKTSRAEIINPVNMAGSANVKFGATVTIVDEDTEEESVFQIVGADESDIDHGRISITSPMARALIGKEAGDQVEVNAPSGSRFYEVMKVEYV